MSLALTGLGAVEDLQSGVESGCDAGLCRFPHRRDHYGPDGYLSLHHGDVAPGLLRHPLVGRRDARNHDPAVGIASAGGLVCLVSESVACDSFRRGLGSGHGLDPALGRCHLCAGRGGHNRDPCLLVRSGLFGQKCRETVYLRHVAKFCWIVPTSQCLQEWLRWKLELCGEVSQIFEFER